jgi:uncharacterized sporulation protein YeaH/YhbH (DUF444 family)
MIENKGHEQLLTSWKEIARYLSKGVRTVQRWERELNLPVRRPAESRHIVVATCSDLDQWVAGMTQSGSGTCCSCQEDLVLAQKTIAELREAVARLEVENRAAVLALQFGSGAADGNRTIKAAMSSDACLKSDSNAA